MQFKPAPAAQAVAAAQLSSPLQGVSLQRLVGQHHTLSIVGGTPGVASAAAAASTAAAGVNSTAGSSAGPRLVSVDGESYSSVPPEALMLMAITDGTSPVDKAAQLSQMAGEVWSSAAVGADAGNAEGAAVVWCTAEPCSCVMLSCPPGIMACPFGPDTACCVCIIACYCRGGVCRAGVLSQAQRRAKRSVLPRQGHHLWAVVPGSHRRPRSLGHHHRIIVGALTVKSTQLREQAVLQSMRCAIREPHAVFSALTPAPLAGPCVRDRHGGAAYSPGPGSQHQGRLEQARGAQGGFRPHARCLLWVSACTSMAPCS